MRCFVIQPATALIVLSAALIGCNQPQGTEPAASTPAAQGAVDRGAYLVAVLDCNGCHTPFKLGPNGPEPDMTLMLSGHPEGLKMPPPPTLAPDNPWGWVGAATNTAFAGPWGVSFAMNLTPDQNAGLGIWTEEMFVTAIRTGKHMATSRAILPPMPWPAYSKLTDGDLKAVFAYLRSIPSIANHVPEPVPPPGPPPAAQ